eukprot:GFUD01030949.1.p1 GENE.GFUD01030949.1~~GFUD01030949.1.p1  ORF type:complete len:318 (-),score=57.96 GFUD01030949.1:141-1070(-)
MWKRFILQVLLSTSTIISSSETNLTHPLFYQVKTDNPTMQNLEGIYAKTTQMLYGYPVYKKFDGDFVSAQLYVYEGLWKMTNKLILAQSKNMSNLIPLENVDWERKADESYIDDSSISFTEIVYPESYVLEYAGDEQAVQDLFENRHLSGMFVKQRGTRNNVPYYEKEGEQTFFLHRTADKKWTISSFLIESGFIFKTDQEEVVPGEHSEWIASNYFKQDILLKSGDTTGKQDQEQKNKSCGNVGLILAISLPCSFTVIVLIIVFFVFFLKKRRAVEEPKIDENEYYGEDEETYDDGDNAVVDTNDYYE